MKRPFTVIGFTVFLTIAFLFDKETGVTAAALAVFAVALVVALFSRKIRKTGFLPLCSVSGAVACVLLTVTNTFVIAPVAFYAGGEHRLKAQITDEVSIRYGKYYFDATSITIDGKEVKTDLRLVFSAQPDVKPYDCIEGNFSFYQPGSSDEDYLNSNRAKGLFLGAYPVSGDYTVISTPDSEKPFMFRIIGIRNKIKRAIYDVYPDENGTLAVGMLLGDKSEISKDTYGSFCDAGIVHLICVSGLHLTLWVSLVLGFLRFLRVRKKLAYVIAAVCIILFMAITGFSYSVLRAGIMMLVYLASKFVMRDPDPINSLGFSVTVIALISPYAIASASLQLSVLATLGILCANEYVLPELQSFYDKIPRKTLSAAIKTTVNSLIVTLSATMFIQPVMLKISGGFNFASIISNLVVTPFASVAMVFGALSALVGCFLPPEFNAFYLFGKILLQYIIKVSGFVASKSFLDIAVDKAASAGVLCIVFLSVCAMTLLAYVYKLKFITMSVASCAVFFVCIVAFSWMQKNETRIRVADTGNGVSVFVTQDEQTVLIGCGGTSYMGESAVLNAQEETNGIDCLVLPSSDKAVTAYAVNVIKETAPKTVCCSSLPDNASLFVAENERRPLTDFSLDGIELSFHDINGKTVTLVETKNVSLLICISRISDLSSLPQKFREADLLVCLSDFSENPADLAFDYTVICANNGKGVAAQNKLINRGVNAVATGGCGDVVIKASEGRLRIGRD